MKWIICSGLRALLRNEMLDRASSSVLTYLYGRGIVFGHLHIEGCSIVEIYNHSEWAVASTRTKQLLHLRGVDVKEVKHNEIVDLSVNGDRWEGDVLNGRPCGWGILYDKNNHKAYEGFRIKAMNVCYGRKYYADISIIEYEGEWYNGVRWGRGTQCDRNGNVVYDGEWLFDKPLEAILVLSTGKKWLHNRVEELIVNDNCCNEEQWCELCLEHLPRLRKLGVGDHCFKKVKRMEVVKLRDLESVVIGKNSFTNISSSSKPGQLMFRLSGCPKLRELRVGQDSFSRFMCVIENMDLLTVFEMTGDYKYCCNSLRLNSILIHHE